MQACVKSSYLWRHFTKLSLNTNMKAHLHGDRRAEIFSECLLLLGNGKTVPDPDGQITMKNIGTVVDTGEELINKVFPHLQQHFRDHKWLRERAILAPKNDAVGQTNSTLLHQIPGPVKSTNLSIPFLIPPKQSSILQNFLTHWNYLVYLSTGLS